MTGFSLNFRLRSQKNILVIFLVIKSFQNYLIMDAFAVKVHVPKCKIFPKVLKAWQCDYI